MFILVLITSCGKSEKEDYLNNSMNWEQAGLYINFDKSLLKDWLGNMDNIEPGNTIIMYFDGTCPSCIISFIEFLTWKREQTSTITVNSLFVAHAEDDLLLKYYLNQFDLELGSDEYLLIDIDNDFPKQNRELPLKSVTYFLIDNDQKILDLRYSFEEIIP